MNNGYIYLKDLLSNERLNPELKAYAKAEVRWWIHAEFLRKDYGKRFAIQSEGILNHFGAIEEYFIDHARFSEQELSLLVETSLSTLFNVSCRPIEALTAFIYRNEETKNLHEIALRFSALTIRQDIKDAFFTMIDSMDSRPAIDIQISNNDFASMIMSIGKSTIAQSNAQTMLDVFAPLFALQQLAGFSQTIPAEIPCIYFADSQEEALSQACIQYMTVNSIEYYTNDSLKELLKSIFPNIHNEKVHIPEKSIEKGLEKNIVYFADKDIMLISKPRVSAFKKAVKPSLNEKTYSSSSPQTSPQKSIIKNEIHSMLQHYSNQNVTDEKPLRLLKKSFLGTIPIDTQLQYANAVFAGDLTLLRRLGVAIDKTIGIEAGIATCKAYIQQFGNLREGKDITGNDLYKTVHTFCTEREN